MNRGELLDFLTKRAKEFRKDHAYYERNKHMHDILVAVNPPTQTQIDAVLVGFINHVGVSQGVDYALCARDLAPEDDKLFGMRVVVTDVLPPNTALIASEDPERPGQIDPKNSVLIRNVL